jgi:hypothetical protein
MSALTEHRASSPAVGLPRAKPIAKGQPGLGDMPQLQRAPSPVARFGRAEAELSQYLKYMARARIFELESHGPQKKNPAQRGGGVRIRSWGTLGAVQLALRGLSLAPVQSHQPRSRAPSPDAEGGIVESVAVLCGRDGGARWGALALALHLDCAHHLKKATGRGRWLLVLKCVALLTSKAKAREPLASPPLPRLQDVRRPAIARRLRAGPRIGA